MEQRRAHGEQTVCAAALLPLAGCRGVQAPLDPQGSDAQAVAELGWLMIGGGLVIFVLVLSLVAYALFAAPARRTRLGRPAFVVAGGIVFPVLTLSALLVYALVHTGALARSEPPALRMRVIGHQWWWRVQYLDAAGRATLVTANEIHLPVGQEVELALESADVLHSFWVPNLAGKLDMIPGRVNRLRLRAQRAGSFRGQCAEYCGSAHAHMVFHVVAQPPHEFDAWLAAQSAAAPPPGNPMAERGRELFLAGPCATCHTVRGTPARGELGPDLTHVGSRRFLAAGLLPTNAGTAAAWIASSQQIKPDNLMPSFAHYSGQELRALAAYLESLR